MRRMTTFRTFGIIAITLINFPITFSPIAHCVRNGDPEIDI